LNVEIGRIAKRKKVIRRNSYSLIYLTQLPHDFDRSLVALYGVAHYPYIQ
jgi:hypothetical protein